MGAARTLLPALLAGAVASVAVVGGYHYLVHGAGAGAPGRAASPAEGPGRPDDGGPVGPASSHAEPPARAHGAADGADGSSGSSGDRGRSTDPITEEELDRFQAVAEAWQERRAREAQQVRARGVLERSGVLLERAEEEQVLRILGTYLHTLRETTRSLPRGEEERASRLARLRAAREEVEADLLALLPEAKARTILQSFPQLNVDWAGAQAPPGGDVPAGPSPR